MASTASGSAEDRTLYVGNLPYDATAEEIEELLERCGVTPVLRVHLPMGPDGRPRGFGFVTLSNQEAVQQSLNALSNADVRGRKVMVKVAHPRSPATSSATGRTGVVPMRAPQRAPQTDSTTNRFESARGEAEPDPGSQQTPEPSGELEEDEEGVHAASGKRNEKKRKGTTTATKRKGGAEDIRRRGGASSWQRWEDWDED